MSIQQSASAMLIAKIWNSQKEWSNRTFGDEKHRGPIGVLKHLAEEVQECIQTPHEIEEYADCFLLILDAVRRAGFTLEDLIEAVVVKHEVDLKRVFPPISEHVDGANHRIG